MARYWIFLNGNVDGPYGVEQLIRIRGFSRQSQVCVEDATGQPQHWISPADIPELAHIFKAIDEQRNEPPPPARPAPKKPAPRAPRSYTPAVVVRREPGMSATHKGWILMGAILLSAAVAGGLYRMKTAERSRETGSVRALIENLRLPAGSSYSTMLQMINEKGLKPRWEIEKKTEGVYQASVSWYAAKARGKNPDLNVFAFEVNSPAQTVRATNSAAARLLSESLSAPRSPTPEAKVKPKEEMKVAPAKPGAVIAAHVDALKSADFESVWSAFSKRKKSEMAKGGISRDGFMRLQALTRRVEGDTLYTLVKTKPESEAETLVLIRQTQAGRPDVFIKQLWVLENGDWKLDDEQKRSAQAPEAAVPAAEPAASRPVPPPSPVVPLPATLPGMSN